MAGKTKKSTPKTKKTEPTINSTVRGTFEGEAGTVERRLFVAGDESALAEVLTKTNHKRLTRSGVISGFAVPAE